MLAENAQLHKEVEHLKRMLSQNIVPEDNNTDTKVKLETNPIKHKDGEVKTSLTLSEKVTLFQNLFRGRNDVFARRWQSKTSGKSDYQPVYQIYNNLHHRIHLFGTSFGNHQFQSHKSVVVNPFAPVRIVQNAVTLHKSNEIYFRIFVTL